MAQIINTEIYGVITKVTPNGCFGEVTLSRTYQTLTRGYKTAVITEETMGRVQLMTKDPSGKLVEGKSVKITSSRPGIASLQILEIKA